jgi:hypothetical protein
MQMPGSFHALFAFVVPASAHMWVVWRRSLATFAPLLFWESRSATHQASQHSAL